MAAHEAGKQAGGAARWLFCRLHEPNEQCHWVAVCRGLQSPPRTSPCSVGSQARQSNRAVGVKVLPRRRPPGRGRPLLGAIGTPLAFLAHVLHSRRMPSRSPRRRGGLRPRPSLPLAAALVACAAAARAIASASARVLLAQPKSGSTSLAAILRKECGVAELQRFVYRRLMRNAFDEEMALMEAGGRLEKYHGFSAMAGWEADFEQGAAPCDADLVAGGEEVDPTARGVLPRFL